jgi:ABC-type phosphate transport system substrate-binding protein
MKSLFRNCLAPLLFLSVAMCAASAYADVVIVVSAKNTITHLTAEQVARIFLGKADTFPDGDSAIPIDQAEGNSSRDEFYAKIIHKSPAQISAYWIKNIYTGDGYPPKQMESEAAIRKAVADNPSVIGYIDRKFVDGSVRIVLAP